jgi:hypothetical protein
MLQNSCVESAKAKREKSVIRRTNKIGPTTKTKIATKTTSRIMTYITLSTPNVSHQRCGEDRRHVFAELYRRIWTSTNQTRVKVEPMSDNLTSVVISVNIKELANRTDLA